MQLILLILASLISTNAFSQDCNPASLTEDDCSFYSRCIEEEFSCGTKGYTISYGEYYCNRFSETFQTYQNDFSPRAHKWRESTSLCLQKKIAQTVMRIDHSEPLNKSCHTIKENAYAHHATCYTQKENSICMLPKKDLIAIFNHRIIKYKDLFFVRRGLKQLQQVRRICIQQLRELKKDERFNWWSEDSKSLIE